MSRRSLGQLAKLVLIGVASILLLVGPSHAADWQYDNISPDGWCDKPHGNESPLVLIGTKDITYKGQTIARTRMIYAPACGTAWVKVYRVYPKGGSPAFYMVPSIWHQNSTAGSYGPSDDNDTSPNLQTWTTMMLARDRAVCGGVQLYHTYSQFRPDIGTHIKWIYLGCAKPTAKQRGVPYEETTPSTPDPATGEQPEVPTPAQPQPSQPSVPTGVAPLITVSQGGAYGCSGCFALNVQVRSFPTGTFTYTCHDNSGPGGADSAFYSHAVTVTDPNQGGWPGVFCYNSAPYVTYVVINGVQSNSVAFAGGVPPPPPPTTWSETVGGVAHTWTNYTNAGGSEGPSIASNQTVQIACKLQGFRVADGNTWWYRIASSPWNSQFYVSADAFYNNGQTSGSLHGTPFVDNAVGDC